MRRATWILWLMLALLPLRSWAVASMALPSLDPSVLPSLVDMAHPAENPPCHDDRAAPADGHASPGCQACDWCHASLATPPQVLTTATVRPRVAPRHEVRPDTGRCLQGGLERPPRHTSV